MANNNIFFSVVIPLYNKELFIEDTIKSVLNQSFQNFEIIVVDDGSSDLSLERVTKMKNKKITVYSQNNQGVSAARNNGIKKAQHQHIALLDADDFWNTNHLEELAKLITTFPEAGLYCNNYQIYYNETLVRPASLNFSYDNKCLIVKDYFKASITNAVAWTSAVAFTKEVFFEIGQFDLKLKTAQDIDLWLRIALKYEIAFNPKITMSYKLYIDNSLSKNEYNELRYHFINNYKEEEQKNASLNMYLDVNRYALAIRCLLNDETELYNKAKQGINPKNLNLKQRLFLETPKSILLFAKKTQQFLKKNKVYITAYK